MCKITQTHKEKQKLIEKNYLHLYVQSKGEKSEFQLIKLHD